MAGKYRALLIGNSTYPADEHNLQVLRGPVKDIAALKDTSGMVTEPTPRVKPHAAQQTHG